MPPPPPPAHTGATGQGGEGWLSAEGGIGAQLPTASLGPAVQQLAPLALLPLLPGRFALRELTGRIMGTTIQ